MRDTGYLWHSADHTDPSSLPFITSPELDRKLTGKISADPLHSGLNCWPGEQQSLPPLPSSLLKIGLSLQASWEEDFKQLTDWDDIEHISLFWPPQSAARGRMTIGLYDQKKGRKAFSCTYFHQNGVSCLPCPCQRNWISSCRGRKGAPMTHWGIWFLPFFWHRLPGSCWASQTASGVFRGSPLVWDPHVLRFKPQEFDLLIC